MIAKIQKWGNSQGVRIPKSILNSAHFSDNEDVEIIVVDGRIIIEHTKRHKSLKERFKNYEGDYKCSELETGSPVGQEVL
ncbi:MAG: AbrB/MazE/SpoVT family DNA-binding domain-containing protein [Acidaminobacteraceae bacterium]